MTTVAAGSVQIHPIITVEMADAVRAQAILEERSVSQIIRRALRDYLAKEQT